MFKKEKIIISTKGENHTYYAKVTNGLSINFYCSDHPDKPIACIVDFGEWFFDAVNTLLRKTENKKKIKTNKNSERIEIRLSNKETLRLIDFWSSAELTKDMVETFIM